MEPVPIKELHLGEFYDIRNRDRHRVAISALLLMKLPNRQAHVLFMNNSISQKFITQGTQVLLRERSLQVETIQLTAVYPYQTFPHLPTVLSWPSNYENEELINQISDEMHRTVSEGRWTFNLPHFLDGYLHIYLSYLRWRVDCPKREERCELLFQFMGSYFVALRNHFLEFKLLPKDRITSLVAVLKGMNWLYERIMEIQLSERILNSPLSERSFEVQIPVHFEHLMNSYSNQQNYQSVKELVSVALEHKMSGELLRKLLPCVYCDNFVFRALASGFTLTRNRQVMLKYFESEQQCLDLAAYNLSAILKEEKLDLQYMFGGSDQIQFIWMRLSSSGFIKRLSPALTREVCGYLGGINGFMFDKLGTWTSDSDELGSWGLEDDILGSWD